MHGTIINRISLILAVVLAVCGTIFIGIGLVFGVLDLFGIKILIPQ